MRNDPIRRRITLYAVSLSLATLLPAVTLGQDVAGPQSVVVIPAANRSGQASLDSVGSTASQTIESSLLMLDGFTVRQVPNEEIPPAVVAGDPAALAQFAQTKSADYVMFGSVSQDAEDRIVIEMAVWDQSSDSVALQAREAASSLFDTFNVADELAIRFLSAFSGRRIAFGSIQLEPGGWDDGSYTVFVDGMEIAVDTPVVSPVLIGDRTLEVKANNGPEAGAILVRDVVTVREAEPTTVAFRFPDPRIDQPGEESPPGVAPGEPEVTHGGELPRMLTLRLQSGGGFLGAGGLDFYPGRGIVRTGLVAGAAFSAEAPIPAVSVSAAVEPTIGRIVLPIGLSSYVTANAEAVTAAVGGSVGLAIRFNRVLHELFLDNVIYFNSYPTAGLPLVYMPVIGVRL